ncbi:DNA primase [Turicibacter sanguinis]|uniref:DNA primase n=1 Tax=Turicibacter sanguinis TaxID=154288 RepID=UPI0018A9778F|nr:DNA primase [Turicibacter sanguinis]MDB8552739.1 DNA primase [Turicibacter sanguinis]
MNKGRIPQELFDQVIAQSDIVDVVSDYVQLTKAGKNYKGLCPFHGENTPSFVVSPDKGIYKCFGCGEGGNVISFISQLEAISYPQAILKLAQRAGIQTDLVASLSQSTQNSKYKNEYDLLEFSKGFYHYYLNHTKEGKIALEYLTKRGISAEMIEQFGIGLSPSYSDALVKTLANNQFSLPQATQLGLLNEHNGQYYDRFKSRIMFPIFDKVGKVVGFSGRVFLEGDTHLGKYVNSPESPLFQKGKLIYNLHEAKLAIRRHNRVLLFEGFLDVISAVEAGILESVATMGTAFTEDHGRELRRLTDHIIICYDGDKAGLAAANKAIPILMSQNFIVSVVEIPSKMDPDEFIKTNGAEAFSKLVDQAIPAIDYQYRYIKRQFNLEFVSHRDQFKRAIYHLAYSLQSPTLQELILKKLAQDISIGEQSILQEFASGKSQVYKNTNINNNKNEMSQMRRHHLRDTKYDRSEKMLIHYMLKDRRVALQVEKELNGYLNDPTRRNIVLYILDYYTVHETMNLQYFLNWIDEALVKPITDIIFECETLPPLTNDNVIRDLILVVKEYVYKAQMEQLKKQISEATLDHEKLELLGKVNQLKQQFGK